jgi:hypothetical protein
MNLKILLLFITLFSLRGFSQSGKSEFIELSKVAFTTINLNSTIDTFNFKIDSINIFGKFNGREIVTINHFDKSKRAITIKFNLTKDTLTYASVSEGKCFRQFYYSNDTLTNITQVENGKALGCIAYTREDFLKMSDCYYSIDMPFLLGHLPRLYKQIRRGL